MKVVGVTEEDLIMAAEALLADGLVVLPTDTVYGVAVRAGHGAAAAVLAAAKGRPPEQAIAVLVGDLAQAQEVALLDDPAMALAGAFWPGPLTLVVPRRPGVALELGQPATTIGVRLAASPVVTALALAVGPLAVTSANRHGGSTPTTAVAAARGLDGIEVVVDGGECIGAASTVVDLCAERPVVLREGAITAEAVAAVLGSG